MNQPLMAVQICIDGSQDGDNGKGSGELATLFATPNHPFWVETPLAENEEKARMHWLAAECLEPCMVLQLADGRSAEVRSAALIRRTQHEGILFAGDDRVDVAQVLCLSDGLLQVAPDERVEQLGMPELGEGYLAPVHNFEVEEFHTYYVGDDGVWVHNTGCPVETAMAQVAERAEALRPVGESTPNFCFAAGTLVHTKQGLVPIEQIQVGDWVLSMHESGEGERAYKRVLRTIKSDKEESIYYVEYYSEIDLERYGPEALKRYGLFVTPGHPFYIRNVGWRPASNVMDPGYLVSHDDTPVCAFDAFTLWETPASGVAVGFGHHSDTGPVIDFNDGKGKILHRKGDLDSQGGISATFCRTVYNLEVEDFHTYYVGELGVWVHNLNCNQETAIGQVIKRAENEAALNKDQPPCFAAGTLVHTKEGLKPIEEIQIGDWVLSYPDDQAPPDDDRFRAEEEYTYKKVTQLFVTEDQPLYKLIVSNLATGDRETFVVTGNHPIYCSGTGWTPVSKMRRAGDVLEDYQFRNLMVHRVYPDAGVVRVYNFEVEDFHTYYVGKFGIWVHNACNLTVNKVSPSELERLTVKAEIYRRDGFKNPAAVDSQANTGRIAEDAGNNALYESTGLDFSNDLRNNSNNGPDEWFLDQRGLDIEGGRTKLYVGGRATRVTRVKGD